jgi:hypothetical protein
MADSEHVLLKIILDSSLTKTEKLKKMYVYMRKKFPKEDKDFIYDYCKDCYERKTLGKKKNESYYYG